MRSTAKEPHRLHVRLLWLSDAMHGSLLNSVDVLRTASIILKLQHPKEPRPISWEIINSNDEAVCLPGILSDRCLDDLATISADHVLLIIPPLHVYNSQHISQIAEANSQAMHLINQHAIAGGSIAATGTGIAFPAWLGLLDDAKIAVPWPHHNWFSRIFPALDFSGTECIAIHNKIYTCVAPQSQIDLMLTILDRLIDPDLATTVSGFLNYQSERQASIAGITNAKCTTKTADSPVHRAIQWLRTHIEEPYRLPILAEAAATSERTLLRHFHEVTGMSPLDYLRNLRVERAKVLLEITIQTVDAIAHACGYSDVASFRRLFRDTTGMTPDAYRLRFSVRAPRTHWKVEDLE